MGHLGGQDWDSGIKQFRYELNALKENTVGTGTEVVKKLDPNDLSVKELFGIDYMNYMDAWNNGYQFGDSLFNGGENLLNNDKTQELYNTDHLANISGNLANISDNTDDISDSVSISEEDLKYMRDFAEREVIDRYIFSVLNIDMSGMNNTINGYDDIDGFVEDFTEAVRESKINMAQGVHS